MLGVSCLVCVVAMCASSSCGVCDLFLVVLCANTYIQVGTAVYPMVKNYIQNRATSDLIRVRIHSKYMVVCVDIVYVRAYICRIMQLVR